MTGHTVGARLDAAVDAGGDSPAFVDGSGVLATHADVARVRHGTRSWLREHGVDRGDRVALMMPGGWQTALAVVSCVCACAAAPLDPSLTDRELGACLRQLGPRAAVTVAEWAPRLRALVPIGVPVLVWSPDVPGGVRDDEPDPSEAALLLFTSGTTAAPKIAALTQGNLAAAADRIIGSVRLTGSDRALNAMPLHHGHGITAGVLGPLCAAGSTVCLRPSGPRELLAVADDARPTWMSAAPVVHHSILTMARGDPDLSEALTMRVIRSTSSPLGPKLLGQLEDELRAPVIEAYALTEAPGHVATNSLDGPRPAGTVGRPDGTRIVLLTDDGELTDEAGVTGEILVRGPNVMSGYLGVPAVDQPFFEGWLRTGDRGSFDDDGRLAISGRVTETISRGAEKIAPAEVEEVLDEHPAVRESAAYGVPHRTLGEESAAVVVLHAGAAVTEDELVAFASLRLAAYKVPVSIRFVDHLPRGRTGKIARRRLAEFSS